MSSGAAAGGGAELLEQVSEVVETALAMDLEVSDEPGSLSLAALTAPSILQLVDRATICLQQLRSHYRSVADADQDSGAASLDDIGALISTAVAAQEICDLAFIAGGQLRICRERLSRAVAGQKILAMVTGADAALCRLRRGFIPIESAIGEYEDVPVPIRGWTDLELSLQVRRLYGKLRREVLSVADPADHEIEAVLEEFARRLAELRASEAYSLMRINDRIQIVAVGRRIASWLADEQGRNPAAGRRIWADFSTFVNLLIEVNNRQELVEYDRGVAARAYHALYANVRPPRVIPEEILTELRTLEGRDPDLDRLILHSDSRRPEDWAHVISRMHMQMESPEPSMDAVKSE